MSDIVSNNIKVKQLNIELVKNALIRLNYGTKLTIANATGLSVATCGNILNELLEHGEVIEIDLEEPNGGRPARRFIYNANYCYVACIYVSYERGVNRITHTVYNLVNEVIVEGSTELDKIGYDAIESLIGRLLAKYNNIKAVGIGVPAVVNEGVIVGECDIKELTNSPLGIQLNEKYPVHIIVENDMNLKALGFYRKQNYTEEKSIAVINFPKENCIGSGIIVDGHVIKGNTNFAGEVSYLPFGYEQSELLKQLNSEKGFIPLAVKTVTSIVAVINPETVVLTGELMQSDMLDDIIHGCLGIIPEKHMPHIIIKENIHEDYMNGLASVTMESLTYGVKLVKKRI